MKLKHIGAGFLTGLGGLFSGATSGAVQFAHGFSLAYLGALANSWTTPENAMGVLLEAIIKICMIFLLIPAVVAVAAIGSVFGALQSLFEGAYLGYINMKNHNKFVAFEYMQQRSSQNLTQPDGPEPGFFSTLQTKLNPFSKVSQSTSSYAAPIPIQGSYNKMPTLSIKYAIKKREEADNRNYKHPTP